MTGDQIDDTIQLPGDALVVTSQNGNFAGFTISQTWVEESGMAIMYDETIAFPKCIVEGEVKYGVSKDFDGACSGGVTSVTLVVYFDESFLRVLLEI